MSEKLTILGIPVKVVPAGVLKKGQLIMISTPPGSNVWATEWLRCWPGGLPPRGDRIEGTKALPFRIRRENLK